MSAQWSTNNHKTKKSHYYALYLKSHTVPIPLLLLLSMMRCWCCCCWWWWCWCYYRGGRGKTQRRVFPPIQLLLVAWSPRPVRWSKVSWRGSRRRQEGCQLGCRRCYDVRTFPLFADCRKLGQAGPWRSHWSDRWWCKKTKKKTANRRGEGDSEA